MEITYSRPRYFYSEKCAKNWTFFNIFSRKCAKTLGFEHFSPDLWHIYGTLHGTSTKVIGQKYLKRIKNIYAQKFTFFSTFFRKIAENRGNSAFFPKICSKNGTYTHLRPAHRCNLMCRKLQKIAVFLNFFLEKCWKTPILSDFTPKSRLKMGHYRTLRAQLSWTSFYLNELTQAHSILKRPRWTSWTFDIFIFQAATKAADKRPSRAAVCRFSGWKYLCKKLQKIELFLTFFDQNRSKQAVLSTFGRKYGTFMGHMWPNIFCTKIAKNCTFFRKIAHLRLFWAIFPKFMGDIAGPHLNLKLHKNCNFFELFSDFQYNLYWKQLKNGRIMGHIQKCGVQKIDKKLTFFSTFQYKCTVNDPKYGTYTGHMGENKCAKNCNFFELFRPKVLKT